MTNRQTGIGEISNLLEIMAALRAEGSGCPWDLEQTFASVAPYTIEEAYEVADAIERNAIEDLANELGDLLLQIVFHAQIAAEQDAFTFADVVARICAKLVRRHPNVFGTQTIATAEQQTIAWEEIKRGERAAEAAGGVLAGVPVGLPGLTRAVKITRRAAGVGFDWPDARAVRAKVDEELRELDIAVAARERGEIQAEMGDVLFALANLCRHLDVDPEACLRAANAKFERRFGAVEAAVEDAGRPWRDFGLPELDRFWDDAKAAERR